MLIHVRVKLAPSVREMIVATGKVFNRKNAAQEAMSGSDPDQGRPARECLCHKSAQPPAANPIVFTLKRSFTALSWVPGLGKVCTAEETSATSMLSNSVSCAAAIRMKGRFTDMFPLIPGSFSFSREAAAETTSRTRTDGDVGIGT